jgi:hypothetical protein
VMTVNAAWSPFPGNPWIGSERKLLGWLLRTATRVPDGPPPSAAELSRMDARRTEHAREGYRAVYAGPGGSIEVQAVRFDTADQAASEATSDVHRLLHPSSRARDQIVAGSILIGVTAGADSDCYRAIATHLHRVK